MHRSTILLALLAFILAAGTCAADSSQRELQALGDTVEGFSVVELPAEGDITFTPEQSLTVGDLRGVTLDDTPPQLGEPPEPYDPRMTDDHPPGEAPYIAEGIEPFRFDHFNNEFSYGGWHNWAMCDYASAHGFNILSNYRRDIPTLTHLPENTEWLLWGGFVNWHKFMPKHNLPEGRYDLLADRNVKRMVLDAGVFKPRPLYDNFMIDMEHGKLSPSKLRQQEWYPADASQAQQQAFEKRYYDGYAKTYTGVVEAARDIGWKDISVYGWQPFPRTWHGLAEANVDPETYHPWTAYGRQIYEAVDILNPSVYCFYWSPQNVAYTLANIDLNMRLINSMEEKKPVRPYYWTLLHGGGSGWRWYKQQPVRNEDVRAMTAMCFFTGSDGMVCWNWSGTGTHHHPTIKPEADFTVKEAFQVIARGAGEDVEPATFERYAPLHINEVAEDDTVTFQRIIPDSRDNHGVNENNPYYEMSKAELEPLLRPQSESVSAMIEGLALVKPLEYILRHGEVQIDVSAQEQFADRLPIVRRVSMDNVHVVCTYDPMWEAQEAPRQIVLKDFADAAGLTVTLPADRHTRIFVLKTQ
ncbi:MAG: hypothetical protein ACLFWB_07025 [Armatimonadota bacterium]